MANEQLGCYMVRWCKAGDTKVRWRNFDEDSFESALVFYLKKVNSSKWDRVDLICDKTGKFDHSCRIVPDPEDEEGEASASSVCAVSFCGLPKGDIFHDREVYERDIKGTGRDDGIYHEFEPGDK